MDSKPNISTTNALVDRFAQPRYANLVPMFIRDLESPSNELRRNAAQALGRLKDKRAVEPLLTLLAKDDVLTVRKAAAKALGKLGDAQAVPMLQQALTVEANAAIHKTISRAIERLNLP